MNSLRLKVSFLSICSVLLFACGSTKDLAELDLALVRNTIDIVTEDTRVDRSALRNDVKGLISQKPVSKGWLNPRTWGTPLAVYNRTKTEESVVALKKYLRNRKGFYHAEVDYKERVSDRKIEVTYLLDLGPRYYISDVNIVSRDTALVELLEHYNEQRLLVKGAPLDYKIFDQEEARLVDIAKDHGYQDFGPKYIEFRGDSTNYDVPVNIYIYHPIEQEKHTKFSIGDVNIYTEHIPTTDPQYNLTDTLHDKIYHAKGDRFVVKPSVLDKIISLKKGETYARKDRFLTNKTLSGLTPYRSLRIDQYKSDPLDSVYHFNIFLTPKKNKWAFDMGADVFYSLLSTSVTNSDLFGVGGNFGWENRNFKNRAISHKFGMEASVELRVPSFGINTYSLQAYNSFETPNILDPFKLGKLLNTIGLLTDKSYKNLNLYGKTEVDFRLGLKRIQNAYDLNTVNLSWKHQFQPDAYNRYIYTQMGIDVWDTNIDSTFQVENLDGNPLLENSFKPYLFTGLIWKELNLSRRTKESEKGSYIAFLSTLEFSGLENLLINTLVNSLTSHEGRWKLGNLNFAEYMRFDADLRYYKKVRERAQFAARFNVGLVALFGDEIAAPFVKSFYVGGPNSLRGWQLREIGAGSYSNKIIYPVANQPFYQVGDFKLEANLEYRFDLFWFWEGALFVDAGNVWTFQNDGNRPGAQLSGSFLNEMAVSAGWGLRFDFSYFLLRFDFGYKVRSPFVDPRTNSHLILSQNGILGNVNFAINYPF